MHVMAPHLARHVVERKGAKNRLRVPRLLRLPLHRLHAHTPIEQSQVPRCGTSGLCRQ